MAKVPAKSHEITGAVKGSPPSAIETFDLDNLHQIGEVIQTRRPIVNPTTLEIGQGIRGVIGEVVELKAEKGVLWQIDTAAGQMLMPLTASLQSWLGFVRGKSSSNTTTLSNAKAVADKYRGYTLAFVKKGIQPSNKPGMQPWTVWEVIIVNRA